MNYTITNIDLNDDLPECETPDEILSCLMSICNKIFPNLNPEITGFEDSNMNDYQIAYSLAKVMYEQMYDAAEKDTELECKRKGIVIECGSEEDLDRWSEIDSKYSNEYCVSKFMLLKWQAEKLMVENFFRILETDKTIRTLMGTSKIEYEKVKTQWEKSSIRQQIIDLAFKSKA